MGPNVSLEDSWRGETPAALDALEGPFSCMRPAGCRTEVVTQKTAVYGEEVLNEKQTNPKNNTHLKAGSKKRWTRRRDLKHCKDRSATFKINPSAFWESFIKKRLQHLSEIHRSELASYATYHSYCSFSVLIAVLVLYSVHDKVHLKVDDILGLFHWCWVLKQITYLYRNLIQP